MADNVGDVAVPNDVSATNTTSTTDTTSADNTTITTLDNTTTTTDNTSAAENNKVAEEKPADDVKKLTTTHLEQTSTSEVKKHDVKPEKVSYQSLSDQLGKIDLKKSNDDVTRILKKETETVEKVSKQEKVEDDLDREIAARMQAFSSGHKPSYSFLSSDTYLPKQTSSSFSASSFYPSSAFVSESGVNSVKGIYESRIRDLEGDLENERLARANTERQKLESQRDLISCKDKLDEARLNFNKQLELIRRREQQLQNVSKQLEDSQSQAELQMTSFKKKHQDTVNELMDQVDELHKQRQKSEKEKLGLQKEVADLKKKADEGHSSKVSLEKQNKALDDQLRELHGTINAMQKEFVEIQTQKGKQSTETGDLRRKVIEGDTKLSDLTSLLDASHQLQNELTTRVKELEEQLVSKNEEIKVHKEEVSKLKGHVDDEKERQNELQKRLTKAINDVTTWQLKCQGNEGLVHPNEVEELKKKFVQKLQESEMKLDATIGKMVALEKARSQSQALSNGLREEIEKLQNDLNHNDKKHKQHDKVVEDWRSKVDEALKQVEEANKEARNAGEKTVKCQQQLEEANEVLERVKRENKNLKVELDDINQQLEFANQKVANSDKLAKEAEAERHQMIGSVNQKDLALQKEAAKFQRLQGEMTSEIEVLERKLADKDVEIEALKKSHNQSLVNLTLSMEDETRSKLDSLKVTKHLEQTINDLQVEVANLKKMLQEEDKVHKKYQNQLADMQALLEDEEHLRKKLEDEHALNLERSSQWKDEADVLRLQVESLERNRKMLEGEVKDNVSKINELNGNCKALTEAKKKLESSVHHCKSDNEDQQMNVRRLEDSLRKAHQDVDRLSEDFKKEKKNFIESDKLRRSLEQQLKEIATRLDSSDSTAGKLAWTRLEERINDLERDLEAERSKVNEKEKEQRKQERRVQEMDLHLVEQQDLQLKLGELCEKMQLKIRAYKKHLDEAEQLSELNLSKFRKLQSGLEEAETRASVAEKLVEELRSRAVSSVTEDAEQRVRKIEE